MGACNEIKIVGVCISVRTCGCGSQCDIVRVHAVKSKLCVCVSQCGIVRVHGVKSKLWVCVSLSELVGVDLSVTLSGCMQ